MCGAGAVDMSPADEAGHSTFDTAAKGVTIADGEGVVSIVDNEP